MTQESLLVGIDFSRQQADFALMSSTGELLEKHRGFANSQAGFQQAKQMLLDVLQQQQFASFALGGEATNYYWLPMFIALCQDKDLERYEPALYLLNARWVHRFKQSKPPRHKNDRIDPGEIADYLRFNQGLRPWQYDRKWLPLRFYTRLRLHLVRSMTREKNWFNLYLFLAYTTYTNQSPFSNLFGSISRTMLKQPELLQELQDQPVAEIAEQLAELSGHRLQDPLHNAAQLKTMLQERFPIDDPLVQPIQRGMEMLLANIEQLEAHITAVEGYMTELIKSGGYPEVEWLQSIPGVGLVLASGIAAEIGDLKRFTEVQVWDKAHKRLHRRTSKEVKDAVAKYCGLWWKDHSSGSFTAEDLHLSREGNAYLRYYVLLAGECMRPRIPSFAAYYQQKYDQSTKHKHKRAMVLTGTKALDLFVALLRRQTVYQAKEGDAPIDGSAIHKPE